MDETGSNACTRIGRWAYGYGTILMSQRKYALVLPLMQRVIALKPDHAKAHHCIAIALRETGDLVGALAAFVKSLEINPQDSDVLTIWEIRSKIWAVRLRRPFATNGLDLKAGRPSGS